MTTDKNVLRYYPFLKLANFYFNMISTRWDFSAIRGSHQTIFGLQPFEHVESKGWARLLFFQFSELTHATAFHMVTITIRNSASSPPNMSDLKTDICQIITFIMEETLQNVFDPIENRLLSVASQNEIQIKILLY